MSRGLVIFDLDETLIRSVRVPLERNPDFKIEHLNVYIRPYVGELLEAVSRSFDVAVWSAGSPLYVRTIVDSVVAPHASPVFVWDCDDCSANFGLLPPQKVLVKDLKRVEKMGFDLDATWIIEDDPVKVRDFQEQTILVSRYLGEPEDTELNELVQYFGYLTSGVEIRVNSMRTWRLAL